LISAGTFTAAFGVIVIYAMLVLFNITIELAKSKIKPESERPVVVLIVRCLVKIS
jgi:hypothetical protein